MQKGRREGNGKMQKVGEKERRKCKTEDSRNGKKRKGGENGGKNAKGRR